MTAVRLTIYSVLGVLWLAGAPWFVLALFALVACVEVIAALLLPHESGHKAMLCLHLLSRRRAHAPSDEHLPAAQE
jgi:cell division protein FtsW (lipid II flippase)